MGEINFEADNRNLSASETTIMKAIWDYPGDIPVQELITILNTQYNKDYARTTVVTFLLKLSDKGFVRTYKKGKPAYVHALKSEDEYRKKLLNENTDFWFKGNVSNVVASLFQTRNVTAEEVAEIRKMLDDIAKNDNN